MENEFVTIGVSLTLHDNNLGVPDDVFWINPFWKWKDGHAWDHFEIFEFNTK